MWLMVVEEISRLASTTGLENRLGKVITLPGGINNAFQGGHCEPVGDRCRKTDYSESVRQTGSAD